MPFLLLAFGWNIHISSYPQFYFLLRSLNKKYSCSSFAGTFIAETFPSWQSQTKPTEQCKSFIAQRNLQEKYTATLFAYQF